MTGGHRRSHQLLIGIAALLWCTLVASALVELGTDTDWPGAGVGRLVLAGALVMTEKARHRPGSAAPDPSRHKELADRAYHVARRLAEEYQGGRSQQIVRHYRKSA